MHLIINGLCGLACIAALGAWAAARRRAHVLRAQLLAFHEAGTQQDKKIAALEDERDRWRNAAEQSRVNAILEVQNLLTYNGSEVGQREFDAE